MSQKAERRSSENLHAPKIYAAIDPDASFKIGTCDHCVLQEQGRPDRAWNNDDDAELDFERDTYFAYLAQLGLLLQDRQAYVCP